jgi:glucose dehydrogenase
MRVFVTLPNTSYVNFVSDWTFAPAPAVGQNGTPMTYLHDGKQYVVVAVGSTDHPAELVALALP